MEAGVGVHEDRSSTATVEGGEREAHKNSSLVQKKKKKNEEKPSNGSVIPSELGAMGRLKVVIGSLMIIITIKCNQGTVLNERKNK